MSPSPGSIEVDVVLNFRLAPGIVESFRAVEQAITEYLETQPGCWPAVEPVEGVTAEPPHGQQSPSTGEIRGTTNIATINPRLSKTITVPRSWAGICSATVDVNLSADDETSRPRLVWCGKPAGHSGLHAGTVNWADGELR